MISEDKLESTETEIGQFKKIALPLVRRIYPQLIVNKIVDVQPLIGPSGLIHYMRYRYSSEKLPQKPVPPKENQGWPIDEPWEI